METDNGLLRHIDYFVSGIKEGNMKISMDGTLACNELRCIKCKIFPSVGGSCFDYKKASMQYLKENHLHPELFI
jgi:hypothetical protein